MSWLLLYLGVFVLGALALRASQARAPFVAGAASLEQLQTGAALAAHVTARAQTAPSAAHALLLAYAREASSALRLARWQAVAATARRSSTSAPGARTALLLGWALALLPGVLWWLVKTGSWRALPWFAQRVQAVGTAVEDEVQRLRAMVGEDAPAVTALLAAADAAVTPLPELVERQARARRLR